MSSSTLGRLALGVVGALIAPVGFAALGFSIGSMVGGMIFAPTTKVEGPRLGDTSVTASSLGKVLPEQFGMTRSAGNVIYSAGLKEVKKKEKHGKGGGGSETTTYHYYCTFAVAYGRGKGQYVRRMWADGKLIYDATGEGSVNNSKYKFRFKSGSEYQRPDPRIAESINRRLAGMDDINKGNQKQATYTTINDLIDEAHASSGARSSLYAGLLEQRKAEAEAGSGVPDYRFTPGYRDMTYIVFDNMPLEDFGNRIPNITAEIVWDGAGYDWVGSAGNAPGAVTVRDVAEQQKKADFGGLLHLILNTANRISNLYNPDKEGHLTGMMGVNYATNKVVISRGSTFSRYDMRTRTEEKRASVYAITQDAAIDILGSSGQGTIADGINRLLGVHIREVLDIYCVTDSGKVMTAMLVDDPDSPASNRTYMNVFAMMGETSLDVVAAKKTAQVPEAMVPLPFATQMPDDGNLYFAATYGDTVKFTRQADLDVMDSVDYALPATVGGTAATSTGPLVFAAEETASEIAFVTTRNSATTLGVYRYNAVNNFEKYNVSVREYLVNDGIAPLAVELSKSAEIANPWATDINEVVIVRTDTGSDRTYVVADLANSKTGVAAFDASMNLVYSYTINRAAPPRGSGQSGYRSSVFELCYVAGAAVVQLDLLNGTYLELDIGDATATYTPESQVFIDPLRAVFSFKDSKPRLFYLARADGSLFQLAATLPDVITKICERSGMDANEFDVSSLQPYPVYGYSIARQSTARQALEVLLQTYFVEGVESDWKAKFQEQRTVAVRTIPEARLGTVSGATGDVNYAETRAPEYALPQQVNVSYSDPARDYQTSAALKSRISNPTPSMYSLAKKAVELPLALPESEAESIAERMLYQSWMSRDSAQMMLDWTHLDLDPGDVVSVKFKDGRITTDRLNKTTLGANFSSEVTSVRADDPVHVKSGNVSVSSGGVPSKGISEPVPSRMFVFDIPLLYDYHATGGTSLRYYSALGADSDQWRGGASYLSWDSATYNAVEAYESDITWGQVIGLLPPPRALWTTDVENYLAISIPEDYGDIVSVTRDEILNGANRALVWNPDTGIAEIIQFQDVTVADDGTSMILTKLTRGLRGTEYAVDKHSAGAYFILLDDAKLRVGVMELSRINQIAKFKGVSVGELITSVSPLSVPIKGRSIMPWAPSRVNVTRSETFGATFKWNRRARIGGEWNMATGIEELPLVEDSEYYEFYLINDPATFNPDDPTTYVHKTVSQTRQTTQTPSMLADYGLTVNDTFHFALYQVSPQIGRGFPTIGTLAP